MDIPEQYVLVSIYDPGVPSFVTAEIEYLGERAIAEQINSEGIRTPKRLLFKGKSAQVYRKWTHKHENCWGCYYKLKADHLHTLSYYFKLDGEYLRANKLCFHGLKCYNDFSRKWELVDAMSCWGNHGIIAGDETGGVYNSLLMIWRPLPCHLPVPVCSGDPAHRLPPQPLLGPDRRVARLLDH